MNAPPPRIDIPDYTNYQPEQELTKLRKRLSDLLRLGGATPETFVQTLLQMWQETEKRRQSSLREAEDLLRKYHALVAQSHAFAAQASIAYSVVNGYVILEERRAQEVADRERERAAHEADAAKEAAAKEAAAKAEAPVPEAPPPEESPSEEPQGEESSSDETEKHHHGGRRKKP